MGSIRRWRLYRVVLCSVPCLQTINKKIYHSMQTGNQRYDRIIPLLSIMTICVCILFGVLVLALLVYIILDCVNNKEEDTFGAWHTPCAGPCRSKGERDCCACSKCAWFVDGNYNGRCIRRGTGPDSCLMRTSPHNRHYYSRPNPYAWYSPYRWRWNDGIRRPIVHRGPGWVKDGWGRWIRSSRPMIGRRRRGRRRLGRRYHHL